MIGHKYCLMPAGSNRSYVVRDHVAALRDQTYSLVGEIIATLILQEGEEPRLFAPTIIEFLRTCDTMRGQVHPQDVPGDKGELMMKVS